MESLTTSEAFAAGAIAGSFIIGLLIVLFILYIIEIIAVWKIFKKAGQPGWKSLIPIYNTYILYKIVGLSFWKWLMLPAVVVGLLSTGSGILMDMGNDYSILGALLLLISLILEFVILIKFISKYAKAFGKGEGFAIGLFFLPNIFQLVLAFGNAKYVKPKNKKNR